MRSRKLDSHESGASGNHVKTVEQVRRGGIIIAAKRPAHSDQRVEISDNTRCDSEGQIDL